MYCTGLVLFSRFLHSQRCGPACFAVEDEASILARKSVRLVVLWVGSPTKRGSSLGARRGRSNAALFFLAFRPYVSHPRPYARLCCLSLDRTGSLIACVYLLRRAPLNALPLYAQPAFVALFAGPREAARDVLLILLPPPGQPLRRFEG